MIARLFIAAVRAGACFISMYIMYAIMAFFASHNAIGVLLGLLWAIFYIADADTISFNIHVEDK